MPGTIFAGPSENFDWSPANGGSSKASLDQLGRGHKVWLTGIFTRKGVSEECEAGRDDEWDEWCQAQPIVAQI